jgi:hypothetical protein
VPDAGRLITARKTITGAAGEVFDLIGVSSETRSVLRDRSLMLSISLSVGLFRRKCLILQMVIAAETADGIVSLFGDTRAGAEAPVRIDGRSLFRNGREAAHSRSSPPSEPGATYRCEVSDG